MLFSLFSPLLPGKAWEVCKNDRQKKIIDGDESLGRGRGGGGAAGGMEGDNNNIVSAASPFLQSARNLAKLKTERDSFALQESIQYCPSINNLSLFSIFFFTTSWSPHTLLLTTYLPPALL